MEIYTSDYHRKWDVVMYRAFLIADYLLLVWSSGYFIYYAWRLGSTLHWAYGVGAIVMICLAVLQYQYFIPKDKEKLQKAKQRRYLDRY